MSGPRTLSLFSGAGGLDLGFHQAGFEIVKAIEIDEKFSDVMRANIGDGLLFGSETEVLTIDVKDFTTEGLGRIDWIIGGPPCQTFSAAGRRASGVMGTDDPRGLLFEEYVEIVKQLKPLGFLYENVYGLEGAQGGEPWRLIKKSFSEAGYNLFHRVLDSADYGVPQHRERLIMVGLREGEFKFPIPTCGPDSQLSNPHVSAESAISHLPFQEWDGEEFGGRWGHLIPDIPPGLNYSFYTSKLGHPNPVFAWRSKFSDFMYKADPDRPVRTIKAQGGKYTGPLHWANRHFTTEELKLLQSFPSEFQIPGSNGVIRHVIGNSVPPALARVLAESVLIQIFGIENGSGYSWHQPYDKLAFRSRKRKLTEYYRKKAAEFHSNTEPIFNFEPALMVDMTFNLDTEDVDLDRQNGNIERGEWQVEIRKQQGDLHLFIVDEVQPVNVLVGNEFRQLKELFPTRIVMEPNVSWDIPYSRIEAWCSKSSPESLQASFKAIRLVLKLKHGIDDLVQLNGYYQQLQDYVSIEVDLTDSVESELWRTAQVFASSKLVGNTIREDEWCGEMNTDSEGLLMLFSSMKTLGYDIRNSSTNPQIPDSSYLVTYRFPTLTSNSVQTFKPLGN